MIYPCESRRITSYYGKRNVGDGFHDGIDIGAMKAGFKGDVVWAAEKGTIALVCYKESYGNMVIINHEKHSTIYGHLDKIIVKEGESVDRFTPIGYMGTTGNSTGVHLHFEVRTIKYPNKYYWATVKGRFESSIDPETVLELDYKKIIQERCKFNNPDEVFKLLEKHEYYDELLKKWARSYI